MLASLVWILSLVAAAPGITVGVDPRIELLAAVQVLSGYDERFGLITDRDFPYRHDLETYFAPFRDHEAVRLFAEMSAEGFSFDAPPTAVLHLTDPPALETRVPFSAYVTRRAGGAERLGRFVEALRAFARDSDFEAFRRAHEGTYRLIAERARRTMGDSDDRAVLESYYGTSQHSFAVVLAPLYHPGGFGPRLVHDDGRADVFSIVGPVDVADGLPVFGTRDGFRHLTWYEFSHSFVNPATERHADAVAAHAGLFEPLREVMEQQAYPDWQTCVNEHVVRAVTSRLAAIHLGEAAGDEALREERRRGFAYVAALAGRLEEYERSRDAYPTFDDFYPRLVDAFAELEARDLGPEFFAVPFDGTINAAMRGDVVFVVPTHEDDAVAQAAIARAATAIRDRFFAGAEVVTDDDALGRDLSGHAVLAYGTPAGNPWIGRVLAGMPVAIAADRIEADRVYEGRGLRFISAWPNPQDPTHGVVIYTAQRAADVVNINAVFHGPTDFVVARGDEVLTSANYDRREDGWRFRQPRGETD